MKKRLCKGRERTTWGRERATWAAAGFLALAGLGALQGVAAAAQDLPGSISGLGTGSGKSKHGDKDRPLPDRLPDKPSFPAAFDIPVEPLGFSAPGAIYLGQRNVLASLDFIDENRLLFTFRVPGLIHREPGEHDWAEERQIRAVVLSLPTGTVAGEALWTVHDRVRYLWMLKDGHFLLRDKDGIEEGDATLALKPYLHFPGALKWMEVDPTEQYLVTNSREPAQPKNGDMGSPVTGQINMTVDGENPSAPEMVVRILKRDSGKVMLVSRTRSLVHLPINGDGYVESLRGGGDWWTLNLNFFDGGMKQLGRLVSTSAPNFDFVSQTELLATACDALGGYKIVALGTDGRHLWEDASSAQAVRPLLVMGPDGTRLARETLVVNHSVSAYAPIDSEDIRGQLVRVFDAANGKVLLEAPANPPLDAGGNVAISPSGKRVAVIDAGAIQVFDLSTSRVAAGPAAEAAKTPPGH